MKLSKGQKRIQNIPDFPNYKECDRKIKLSGMIKHFTDCQHLSYKQTHQHLKLNTILTVSRDKNIKFSNKPLVYKLEELEDSRNWFILQGWSRGDQFMFFLMHHSREILEEVYYKLKVYGWDSDGRSMIGRCTPMGIELKNAVKNGYTLDISITNLEKICLIFDLTAQKNCKLRIKFSVIKF